MPQSASRSAGCFPGNATSARGREDGAFPGEVRADLDRGRGREVPEQSPAECLEIAGRRCRSAERTWSRPRTGSPRWGAPAVVYESPVTLTIVDEPNGTLILITCAFWRSAADSVNTFVVALDPGQVECVRRAAGCSVRRQRPSCERRLARDANSAVKSNGGAVRVTLPVRGRDAALKRAAVGDAPVLGLRAASCRSPGSHRPSGRRAKSSAAGATPTL